MSYDLPYDAVLFDLDGTLTESERGIINAVQYALHKMGVDRYKNEELTYFVGPPLLYSFKEQIGLTHEQAVAAIDHYRVYYSEKGLLENSVYRGIPAMLRSLKARGAYLAVATAKPLQFATRVLKAFDLYKYFDAIGAPDGEDEDRSKARLIRRALKPGCRRAVMVGDRSMDVEAAAECGIDGVGVLYGYGNLSEFSCAKKVVSSVQELTDFLLGSEPPARGRFITLEGPDGCGKTTQHALLCDWLRLCGHEVVATREPGGCDISERIRRIVLDKGEGGMVMTDVCEALLFAASRSQHVHDVIDPALSRGATVVCDRFVDSSVAYQGAGRGLGVDYVRGINAPAVAACVPDCTILYDLDPSLAMTRRAASCTLDRIEKASADFSRRVYDAYIEMAKAEPDRFLVVDADGSPLQVFERTREALMARL